MPKETPQQRIQRIREQKQQSFTPAPVNTPQQGIKETPRQRIQRIREQRRAPQTPQPEDEDNLLEKVGGFLAPTTTGLLTGEKELTGRSLLGAGLEIGSFLVPAGAAVKGLTTLGRIGRAASVGAKSGALFGAGQQVANENADLGDVIAGGAVGGALGGVGGGVLGGVGGYLSRTFTSRGQKAAMKSEIDELLTPKSLAKETARLESRNVPIREMLTDPQIYKGLKVKDAKVNPSDAIFTIEDRLNMAQKAKQKLMPTIDKFTAPVTREELRKSAINKIGEVTPADKSQIIARIDKQIAALPDDFKISKLDKLRAQFRGSAYNAKGEQKPKSHYAALENAARELVFDKTDNLPFDTDGLVKGLNIYIKDQLALKKFLTEKIQGQSVKGGRLGEIAASGIGAVAGAKGGPIGVVLGSKVAGKIQSILVNNRLGSKAKLSLIKEVTDDPAVIKAAEQLLRQAGEYRPPLGLPAPATPLGPRTTPTTVRAVSAQKLPAGSARVPKGQPGGGQIRTAYSSTPAPLKTNFGRQ
jgi:hypothetical protein